MSKRLSLALFAAFCIGAIILSIITGIKLHSPVKPGADIIAALFVLLSVFICFVSGFVFFRYDKLKIEKIFAVFFVVFGFLYMVIIPMFGSNDEPNHWKRILQISRGDIMSVQVQQEVGGFLPSNTVPRLRGISDLFIKFDEKNIEFFNFGNTAAYSPLSYTLHLPGVLAANLISNYVYANAYAGRLSCLILSFFLLYFVIRKIPIKKKTLFVLITTPLFLQETATLNADVLLNIVSYAAIVLILFYSYGEAALEKIKIRTLLIIILLSLIISMNKTAYFPLILLFLMLPSSKFQSQKQKIISISVLFIICFIIDLLWTLKTSGGMDTDFNNMAYVFANPISFAILFTKNVIANFPYAVYGSFGGNLGFSVTGESPISKWLIYPYVLSILFTALSEKYYELKKNNKFLIFVVLFSTISLFSAAMIYANLNFWQNPNGIVLFTGARYYIPVWFLTALFIASFKTIHINIDEEKVFRIMLLIIPFIHLAAYSTLIIFYSKYL
ncbi:MAG: DUF2142 domain-containing protein [Elusimicrobiota bacterium]|jgi:uncharacterized membrane protein|nr:DUF2142 domain-containing protein [Elusimicrobiota bacterium]